MCTLKFIINMATRAEKNKRSTEITKIDGRVNNKRLKPIPISTSDKLVPARNNKAKKRQDSVLCCIGYEKKSLEARKKRLKYLTKLAKNNFSHMKLLLEYAYGRPSDSINDAPDKGKTKAPVINFINNQEVKENKDIIDITDKKQ